MILQIKEKDNRIFSHIREKWLEKTPEEIVRQNFVCELVNEYGYSLEQMEEEKNLTENSDRGTGKAAADIVVWKSEKEKLAKNSAFLVVECKAENIDLTSKDYFQGANYAKWSGAQVLVVVNSILKETKIEGRNGKSILLKERTRNDKTGGDIKVFKILENKLPYVKQPISNIPHASLLDNKEKLKEELTKTTTMTRDDFVRLLLQCHNIIRNNDKLSPEAAFDEISKILFIKIRYERAENEKFSLAYFRKSKENYASFKAKRDKPFYQFLFERTKEDFSKDNLFADNEKIEIRENSFEEIVEKLQIYDLSNTSDDVKGIAFEQFLGKTFRGELGQFFTPRTLVNFMVEVLDPKEGELICDPACGSGGFLIKAFEYIREQITQDIQGRIDKIQAEIFGTIDETATDKERKEFNKKLNDPKLIVEAEEKIKPLENELKLSEDRKQIKTRIDKLSKTCIFGTDANPRMARVSKMNMIMHGDGHGGVHRNDGLLNVNGIFEERFDVILANPPFGSRVSKDLKIEIEDKYTDEEKIKAYRKMYGKERYDNAMKQVIDNIGKKLLSLYDTGKMSALTEVLFIERSLNLLKKGGRMGIVLPAGVLNNLNLQKVREYFEGKAKILLITSIPQDVFVASGATVKPSLVFLKKFTEKEEREYTKIQEQSRNEIEEKYKKEVAGLGERIKAKKPFKDEQKALKEKMENEIKKLIKEKFDYMVPIAEVEKAGISTTGAVIENELGPLAKEFAKYRKKHNLWQNNLSENIFNEE